MNIICAEVAELADAQDLKSRGTYLSYRFDSGLRHQKSGPLAQLVRAPGSKPVGLGFESLMVHHYK